MNFEVKFLKVLSIDFFVEFSRSNWRPEVMTRLAKRESINLFPKKIKKWKRVIRARSIARDYRSIDFSRFLVHNYHDHLKFIPNSRYDSLKFRIPISYQFLNVFLRLFHEKCYFDFHGSWTISPIWRDILDNSRTSSRGFVVNSIPNIVN